MKIRHHADHAELRREAYPPVEEQLDALWHAMEKGLLPRVPGFHDRIKAVKARYPKPARSNS